jgi:hypothetical protein
LYCSEGANQVITGTATDTAGLTASTSVTLMIDKTLPILAVTSPAEGASSADPNVLVSGTTTDALSGSSSVTCNGAAASISGSDFSCNISLAVGVNLIVVRATDVAGNVAALPLHLTLAGTLPPPTSLQITPAGVNLLVGQTQQFTAVDEQGRPRNDATWTLSDTSLATVTTDAEPVLTAVAVGQVTLTANVGGSSAQVQVNILAGTSLPAGTVRWSAPPIPGFTTVKILQAVPAGENTPDLYSIETDTNGNSLIRAFTGDGRQMWQRSTAALGILVDAIPDGFGGLLTESFVPGIGPASLADLDGVTGSQLWQYTSPAPYGVLTGDLAIGQDGKVLGVEIDGNYASSSLLALDGTAGQPRFRAPVPHGRIFRQNFWCDGRVNVDASTPASTGRPAVGPDGSVFVEFSFSDDSAIATDCQGGEPFGEITSFTNTLSLLHVLPDGSGSASVLSSSSQFVGTPGIVIPDGQGGALATWTLAPVSPDPNYVDPTRVTHVGTQGTNVHFLPSLAGINSMVLGENGTAFATDGSTVVSFDVNSGLVNWSYQAPSTSSVSIIASTAGNGLVAKLTDYQSGFDTVVRLDSTGQPTLDAWQGVRLDYDIGEQWLGFPSTGAAFPAFSAPPVEWSSSIWARPDQNLTNAATPKIKVRVFSVTEANVSNDLIRNVVQHGIDYW